MNCSEDMFEQGWSLNMSCVESKVWDAHTLINFYSTITWLYDKQQIVYFVLIAWMCLSAWVVYTREYQSIWLTKINRIRLSEILHQIASQYIKEHTQDMTDICCWSGQLKNESFSTLSISSLYPTVCSFYLKFSDRIHVFPFATSNINFSIHALVDKVYRCTVYNNLLSIYMMHNPTRILCTLLLLGDMQSLIPQVI